MTCNDHLVTNVKDQITEMDNDQVTLYRHLVNWMHWKPTDKLLVLFLFIRDRYIRLSDI